ncbi:Reverse transcriptase [Theobroma cacao]|nr:Reverse transcriptase [Theobroma cacao]
MDELGNVGRDKARIVNEGYNQKEGIDYDETFAPIARLETIRLLLAYACFMNIKLFQMDVKSGEFEMSLLGELKFFFCLQIKQCEDGIFINQEKYTKEMLKKFDVMNMKSIGTPMSPSTKLDKDDKGKNVDQKLYRELRLMIKQQLNDFGMTMHMVPIYGDNMNAINISKNLVQQSRTKHIDIRHHFIRDHVLKGDIMSNPALKFEKSLKDDIAPNGIIKSIKPRTSSNRNFKVKLRVSQFRDDSKW